MYPKPAQCLYPELVGLGIGRYKVSDSGLIETKDIDFSAFLRMNDFPLADYQVLSRGKGIFYFKMTQEEWKKMKLKFSVSAHSELKRFKLDLKDLLYQQLFTDYLTFY